MPLKDSAGYQFSIADLAIQRIKLAIFYDGEGHLHRSQRDHDSKSLALADQGDWTTFRVTWGMLGDAEWMRAHVGMLIAKAEALLATSTSPIVQLPRLPASSSFGAAPLAGPGGIRAAG